MKQVLYLLIYLLLLSLACLAAALDECAVEALLGSREVWVHGTCMDYYGNELYCEPGSETAGRGVTVSPGQLVISSGCFTKCVPLKELFSYRVAPLHADTVTRFATLVGVIFGLPALIGRARARRSARKAAEQLAAAVESSTQPW